MDKFIYTGDSTKEISFPLGGIGSGCIGLAGNGRLIDWEIFNKPNKGSVNGFSHFAVKAESNGKLLDARVLNSDIQGSYTGQFNKERFNGYGFGPFIETMAGFPHFKNSQFLGEFPIAVMTFIDEHFPGSVKLTAFNPFIPMNDKDSSIPGAFFEIEFYNDRDFQIDYTISLSVKNPLGDKTYNKFDDYSGIKLINMYTNKCNEKNVSYGDICVATDSEEVSYQEYWYRGGWFDTLSVFWRNFTSLGKYMNRNYEDDGKGDMASLAAHLSLKPEERKSVKFLITWNFPNNYNYWNPLKFQDDEGEKDVTWKNYYAVLFKNSKESAIYSIENWDKLYKETLEFKNSLFSSTLPEVVIDAVSSNLSVLKSPTVLRLEDGSFYGWEGVHEQEGSCEGSCTHVWNYAYALPFLFPKLERSMRDLDFKYNQREDGGMSFRLQLPIGRERSNFRPCADGQFGGVIKAYRDWKISGDSEWLKQNWEAIKKSIEYAWAKTNADKWDLDKDGVLEGRQHHTLDMELFGPNSWLEGFYLAALKAGAEMAQFLGETEKSEEYMSLFKRGKAWTDKYLFNGEYYQQSIDLKNISLLEEYVSETDSIIRSNGTVIDAYWNDEVKEIKYQIADGCEIDQVSAQWHANIVGLGEIFDNSQVKLSLKSLYKNNFKENMREVYNPCRLYCLNDEAGIVICDWPEGKVKPMVPLPYAEEAQNGYEYQAAALMIQEGLIEEGLRIIVSIRERYNGRKRNPWNEFECGNNYARSMASYSLILAFSGFKYNMVKNMIGFNPIRLHDKYFKSFWAVASSWGSFEIKEYEVNLEVLYGTLTIKELQIDLPKDSEKIVVTLEGKVISCEFNKAGVTFRELIEIRRGAVLKVSMFNYN